MRTEQNIKFLKIVLDGNKGKWEKCIPQRTKFFKMLVKS